MAIIFFFITSIYHPSIFKPIEISIVNLPEKEESKTLKPKVEKSKMIGIVKRSIELKAKKIPNYKPIIPPSIKYQAGQEVRKIIPPITIPPASVGVKKNEFHDEIPIAKAIHKEGISQTEEEKSSQVTSPTPYSEVNTKGSDEGSRGPYIYISGPASERKVLYQPKFKPPYWLEKSGQSIRGKFKIWVLPDGSVDKVEIEESFGYAEIDKIAKDTVYKWRFFKLPSNINRIDWGIVIITIRLE